MRRIAAAITVGLVISGGLVAVSPASADTPLAAGTYCQGPQTTQPVAGPKKVILLDLENESSSSVQASPDAPFENNTLAAQCGTFSATSMHSTTHGSESNYLAEVSGLNSALTTGADVAARFGLSNCPPDSTSSACVFGGGHFASTVPSLFSQAEQVYGTSGWKTYADDMPSACYKDDAGIYATDGNGKSYPKYVARHNPAVYFNGIACQTQDVPSGSWQTGQGTLYTDLMSGSLPAFSFIQPNDIENGHDPVSVGGVTVAGGKSSIANGDNYLASLMALIQTSPDYQSGNLVVMITYDEGYAAGPVPGENTVGQNCADPNISPLATSCQVPSYIVGRYTPNYLYTDYMNQFGLLAATQRIIGVSPLLGHAADATTPDIVNGTTANPNPFNLAPNGTVTPPTPTVPTSPTAVTANAGNTNASVTFTAPTSTGGAPITSYTVTSTPGNLTATGPASPITVPGLTNGTAYTFKVTATNSVGPSAPSNASNSVTPVSATNILVNGGFESGLSGVHVYSASSKLALVTTPTHGGANALQANNTTTATTGFNAPTIPGTALTAGQSLTGSCWVQATGTNYKARIRFSEGTTYTVIGETISASNLTPGVWTQVSVTGTVLKTGDQMILSAYTTNQIANGPGLIWDDCSVTAGGGTPAVTAPGSPTAVTAIAGDTTSAVSFTAPASTGGAAITGYTVTSTPGNLTATGSASPITVAGLTNGTSYTFTVTATNSAGTSAASAPSNAVIPNAPATPPTAPLALIATPVEGGVTLAWTVPASNGGGAITDYVIQYALADSNSWTTFPDGLSTASSAAVTGLVNGTGYDFRVAAVNGSGTGGFSATASATPAAVVPNAPTAVTATPASGSASISFTPPTYNGGSPITSYTVTSSPSGFTATGAASPITVSGLTNGTAYAFTVTAQNAIGPSVASAASAPVTPTAFQELLPDPGFEVGNGGWVAFQVGTLSRVTTPVHGGTRSLKVAATTANASLVGLTQNSVVSNTVAGRSYTASCYVQPTSANLNVSIRFLEYTQNYSSNTHFQTVTLASLPLNTWTQVTVTTAALRSGERMIPQIYSSNETTATGSLLYDDCSVS